MQLDEINDDLVRFSERKAPKRRSKSAKAKSDSDSESGGRGRKSKIKDNVVAVLKEAGPEGVAIKDMAERIGVKHTSLNAWFSTTGKKIAEIVKVGTARYTWKQEE